MGRQQQWHTALLPALFFSLLLHAALLPLWRQPLQGISTDLPTLQVNLLSTTNTVQHNTIQRQAHPSIPQPVSPKTESKRIAKDHKPKPASHTSTTVKPRSKDITPAVKSSAIVRPNKRQRARPEHEAAKKTPDRNAAVVKTTTVTTQKSITAAAEPLVRRRPMPESASSYPALLPLQPDSMPKKTTPTRHSQPTALLHPTSPRSAHPILLARPPYSSRPANPESGTRIPIRTQPKIMNPVSKSQVLAWLNRQLRKYFFYPGMARRRNIEGTVILQFQVKQNGQITDARIAQSSGAGILDRAAITSLHKLGLVALPLEDALDLKLPIIYRLDQRG